jgi:hypothetical protein
MINKDLMERAGKIALFSFVGIGSAMLIKNLFRKKDTYNSVVLPSIGASISKDEARLIANSQLSSMDLLGTDEDTLFQSLENLSGADLRKVFNEFGRPCYNGYTQCVGLDKYLGGRDLDLFGWYAEELGESDKKKMRDIWAKTGLTLPF